jgi:hypothetical protein
MRMSLTSSNVVRVDWLAPALGNGVAASGIGVAWATRAHSSVSSAIAGASGATCSTEPTSTARSRCDRSAARPNAADAAVGQGASTGGRGI